MKENLNGSIRQIPTSRKSISVDLDEDLVEWIVESREKQITIKSQNIRDKAVELFNKTGNTVDTFVPDHTWLRNFMKRNNLRMCDINKPDFHVNYLKKIYFVQ